MNISVRQVAQPTHLRPQQQSTPPTRGVNSEQGRRLQPPPTHQLPHRHISSPHSETRRRSESEIRNWGADTRQQAQPNCTVAVARCPKIRLPSKVAPIEMTAVRDSSSFDLILPPKTISAGLCVSTGIGVVNRTV